MAQLALPFRDDVPTVDTAIVDDLARSAQAIVGAVFAQLFFDLVERVLAVDRNDSVAATVTRRVGWICVAKLANCLLYTSDAADE